jgi:hypothetical protein
MAMIYVKTREGRRAYYEGKIIPQDKFVPVPDNPYTRRLVLHHEDVEIEGGVEQLKPKAKTLQTSSTGARPSEPLEAGEPTQPVKPTT